MSFFIQKNQKKTSVTSNTGSTGTTLQLQAYERLIILTERISLTNLIRSSSQFTSFNAGEMQQFLLQSINDEVAYNASQQLYVSNEAWTAVRNLKEQNLSIIHQCAQSILPDESGNRLNKAIIEAQLQKQDTALDEAVLQLLKSEARKLL